MKKLLVFACVAIISFAFTTRFKSGIYGTIDPMDGAKRVWAISGRDSVSTLPVDGKFSLEVKPATYRVIVEAIDASKNTSVENVAVLKDQYTDVGVIKLP